MANILVIKHGALGDVVLATGCMSAIRRHHAGDRITLLTTRPFAPLLEASGWFDEIWVDDRPNLLRAMALLALRRRLIAGGFARVYDLQTSGRSSWYFRLFPRSKPEWSGIAPGCSHPDLQPGRERIHNLTRIENQLHQAGIADVPKPTLDFLTGDVDGFGIQAPYALLVPGSAAHRPEKRWPAAAFGELARRLLDRGLTPVLIGGKAEAEALAAMRAVCPAALDLGGQTSFAQIATLARGAAVAVGNDTGPMHLAAAAGAPVLTLFSGASNPVRSAPGGPSAPWLQRDPLAALTVDEVMAALAPMLDTA